jgi:hypothetical protein
MDREVILVLGKTGYGKSVWTKNYSAPIDRLLVYDLCQEYPVVYHTGDEIVDMLTVRERIPVSLLRRKAGLGDKFKLGVWRVDDCPFISALAFVEGNCTLVLEEFSTIHGRGERMHPWLSENVYIGRHRRVSIVGTAQRAASIPIDLRSQASRVVSFRQTESNDMDWLEDYFEGHTGEISSLDKLECLDASQGTVKRYSIASYLKGAKPDAAQSTQPLQETAQ